MIRFIALFAFFTLTTVGGWLYLAGKFPPERTNPVDSQINPVGSQTDPVDSKSAGVEVEIDQPVEPAKPVKPGSLELKFEKPEGVVIEAQSALEAVRLAEEAAQKEWQGAMLNFTSATAHLSHVEKFVTRENALLPEAVKISVAFEKFNHELDALKSSSLSGDQRDQIRESLKKSTGPMLNRIHEALAERQANHLVHLAQTELARVMESIQEF